MAYQQTEKVKKKLQDKKEAIVTAAKDLLVDQNYNGLSIKSIAKKAGIATGTLYLYFSNKDQLIETVVDEMYLKLLDSIKQERSKQTNVLNKLTASMEATIKLFIKEQHLAKILLIQIPAANQAFNLKLNDFEKELIQLTESDLQALIEQGVLPKLDIQIGAMAFVGSFRQVIMSWLSVGEPKNLDAAYKTLIQYNLRGLGKDE